MGKFDGVLICSDFDGTLAKSKVISEVDTKAIKRFQENGGIFTVVTGRPLFFLEIYFNIFTPNTYVATLNGAKIIHPTTRDVVFEEVSARIPAVIDDILKDGGPFDTMNIYVSPGFESIRLTREEYVRMRNDGFREELYKVSFMINDPEKMEEAKKILTPYRSDFTVFNSWHNLIEILPKGADKGNAIRVIKEATEAKISIGVGDFENDIDMLHNADIGYAPSNALEEVKRAATRVTKAACGEAIAEIISDIENGLI